MPAKLASFVALGKHMLVLNVVAGVEYGVVEPPELAPMAKLLSEVFSRHDPLAVAVGLPQRQVEAMVAAWGPRATSEELSVVARTPPSGEIVGAVLAMDFCTPAPDDLERAAPGFSPIGALLDGLDCRYRAARDIEPGAYAHLFMIGVADHAANRGIAHALTTTWLAHAKARGYRHAVTEATGTISQHVLRKCGFRDVLTARYSDYTAGGARPFSSIVGPTGTVLMDREI